jgi:hypothetical protein
VLIGGGTTSASSILASVEIYEPNAGTFRAVGSMITARRMHTATLLPDDRILIVGGYGVGGALASAELFDPVTGTFSATGSLSTARGGHSAILLSTGKVLIVGGYGGNTYPNVAPAELYDPASGTFTSAGAYVGRDGCDFCAPSVLLPDGTVLFPGQYPAQLYDPTSDAFSPIAMMIHDQSTAAVLPNGQVLFTGGEGIGRLADAELYNPATHKFASTGSMASRRVWHSLSTLPSGMVLVAGGETDSCVGSGCWFAGTLATAELYDPSAGAFVSTGGSVSYGQAFSVQPFNNYDVAMDMTGSQILSLLDQQWSGTNAASPKILQVSGITYSYSKSGTTYTLKPETVQVNGAALDKARTYRVVANSFLSDGGDGFGAFTGATEKYFGGLDIDAFSAYLAAHDPYTPVATDRINVTP